MRPRIAIVLSLLTAGAAQAAPVRIAAWDLRADSTAGHAADAIGIATNAAALLNAQPCDVILLQHVADWEQCRKLAESLRPAGYHVAACASWDAANSNLPHQTAILTRSKARISWSSPWESGEAADPMRGGYSFASMELDGTNIGFFSAQLDGAGEKGAAECVRQLEAQLEILKGWKTGRPEAFVIAGNWGATLVESRSERSEPVKGLRRLGFENATAAVPVTAAPPGAFVDGVFTLNTVIRGVPELKRSGPFECEALSIELIPGRPAVVVAKAAPAPAPAKSRVAAAADDDLRVLWWICGGLAAGVGFFGCILWINRVGRPPAPGNALATTGAGALAGTAPDGQSISPEASAGVVAHLTAWLKQGAVSRLVADRAGLMATQKEAALKALAVDQRLDRLEIQVRLRNEEYEKRIDELTEALAVAEEQNREMIRAQIAMVKAEMERARLKAAQAGHFAGEDF